MDSERFDGPVRSAGQRRSRRQTLRGLAGAGAALAALLAAAPGAMGKVHRGKAHASKGQAGAGHPQGHAGKHHAGKHHAGHAGKHHAGTSPLGHGRNGPAGNGQAGSDRDNATTQTTAAQAPRLGGALALGVSVSFSNQNSGTFNIRVIGVNGDVSYAYGPNDSYTLSFADSGNSPAAVTFVVDYPGWADRLYVQAVNPFFGEPAVAYDKEKNCFTPGSDGPSPGLFIPCGRTMVNAPLSVGGSVTIPWLDGKSFEVERQSDSDDYKMFLVTALAD